VGNLLVQGTSSASDHVGYIFAGIVITIGVIVANLGGLDLFRVLRVHPHAFGLLGPAQQDGHDIRERPPKRFVPSGPDYFGRCSSCDFIDCHVHRFITNHG
jgi:hypothetical protein